MEKTKKYFKTRFGGAAIQEAREAFSSLYPETKPSESFSISSGDVSWRYDNIDEFLASLLLDNEYASYRLHRVSVPSVYLSIELRVTIFSRSSEIQVSLPKRSEIEQIFNIFERHAPACYVPEPADDGERTIRVFIGHGRSSEWRDLKDHLQDKHGYEVVAYEVGSRAGHGVRDILEDMLEKASCAFLVLSGEDEMTNGTFHARQNVIHETGLFQGRLGFSRAIVLLEEGAEEFSNIAGIEQLRYSKGRIKETFGDILAVLRREFGPNI